MLVQKSAMLGVRFEAVGRVAIAGKGGFYQLRTSGIGIAQPGIALRHRAEFPPPGKCGCCSLASIDLESKLHIQSGKPGNRNLDVSNAESPQSERLSPKLLKTLDTFGRSLFRVRIRVRKMIGTTAR